MNTIDTPASPFWREARSYCMRCSRKGRWVEVKIIGCEKESKQFYIIECEVHKEKIYIESADVYMKKTYRINGPQHFSFGFFNINLTPRKSE